MNYHSILTCYWTCWNNTTLLVFGSPPWLVILCCDVSLDIPLTGFAHTALLIHILCLKQFLFYWFLPVQRMHVIGELLPTKTAGTALLSRMDGNLHSSPSHDDNYKRVQTKFCLLPIICILRTFYSLIIICHPFNHGLCEHALFCSYQNYSNESSIYVLQ